MKNYNIKLHWLFSVATLVIGFGIGYLIFHKKPTQDDGFVKEQQENAVEEVKDAINKDSIHDVEMDSIEDAYKKIIRDIHEKANKAIAKGIYPPVYDSIVRSNHRRGIKRYN